MKRRDFFTKSLAGTGLAIGSGLLSSCGQSNSLPSNNSEKQDSKMTPFPLEEQNIDQLQEGMANGQYTAKSIVELYLQRIEEVNPLINAVIELNPEAIAIAEALDQERKEKGSRGPMHGIPVLLKDNIDTGDKMHTTAGSLALANNIAAKDAFIVAQMRKAGAIILGKTNLSEWANFRSTRSSSGWSSKGGQTRNPYDLDRSPCGSSSGSGAAVSANLCAVAIGTETDGSVICPSALCGIVGIKPTLGLASRSGIIPIAHSQDTAGPMAKTVKDAVLLLGAITGIDANDPITQDQKIHADYTPFLKADSLQGARLGIMRSSMGVHEKVDQVMEEAFEVLRKAGASLIDLDQIIPDGGVGEAEFQVLLYEFKADLNQYLGNLNPEVEVRSLADLIAFNKANSSETMPFFGQEILLMAQEKGPLSDEQYLKALKKCKKLSQEKGIDAVFAIHQLDAIIAPADAPAWKIDRINGDHYLMGGKASYSPAAVSGYPNISVPAGYVHHLPIGISFTGTAYSEPRLIGLAYAFEQLTQFRKAPGFQKD